MPIVTFEAHDVVVVPFPFTERAAAKRRPALVLSLAAAFNLAAGHCVLAMITTARHEPWPLDVPLADLAAAGLRSPSIVRMKLFTLDARLIARRIGALGTRDRRAVAGALRGLLGG
jgi:mRNA interferase MazF